MNYDSIQQIKDTMPIYSSKIEHDESPSFYNQFVDTMGVPIMLLLLTYACKMLIHNSAKWSDFWKAIIEFPIDFMSIAISVYVTYKYLSIGSNIFLTEFIYFIMAVIICCFSRKVILNNTHADKIGKRQAVNIIISVVVEFVILFFAVYYLISIL